MKQTFLTTWHPAALFQDMSRTARSFLIHCEKAVKIARGKRPDRLPKVLYNPSAAEARKRFASWDEFTVDIETASVSDTRMLCIAAGAGQVVMVWSLQDPKAKTRTKPLMEAIASDKLKVFQNADFDVNVLRDSGWECPDGTFYDTMLAHQILYPDEPVNLSFLASLVMDTAAWKHIRVGDPQKLMFYNAVDVWTTDAVYTTPPDDDLVTEGMMDYVDYRMPTLWKTIIPLNRAGIKLDQVAQRNLKDDWNKKMRTWKIRLMRHCKKLGYDPPLGWKGGKKTGAWTNNISNKRASELLYDSSGLGLPVMEHPKTGAVTVDANALEKLEDLDESGTVSILLERSRFKDVETPGKIKPDSDGLVYSRFVFGGDEKHDDLEVGKESPSSGRLASREPNLQNIKEWVRCIFVSRFRNGWLLKADYSQIELRMIALLSGDSVLQEAIETDAHLFLMYLVDQDTDLHGLHKKGWPWLLKHADDPIVKMARKEQKRVNFGWPYRMGAKKVENQYGVPYPRAKKALEGLNHRFYRVVDWWDSLIKECKQAAKGTGWGHLVNDFGRIRRFHLSDSQAVPKMCAFKPSSSAADVLYDAMDELTPICKKHNSILCLTVHDELVIDTRHPEVLEPIVREVMERPIKQLGNISIPVDIQVGKNWATQSKINPNGQMPFKKWRAKYGPSKRRR